MHKPYNFFHHFATKTSQYMGTSWAFIIACLSIIVWLASGPFFHWNELIINTSTTICTTKHKLNYIAVKMC